MSASFRPHRLQIGVLERGAHDRDLVDVHPLGDKARRRSLECPRGPRSGSASARLRSGSPRRRTASARGPSVGHDPPMGEDHDPVAHALQLAEQVGVDQHRDPAVPELSSSIARIARRPAGSSALVGSSSSSSVGSPMSACAIPSRCCIPFDMPFDPAAARLASARRARAARPARPAHRRNRRGAGEARAPQTRCTSRESETARRDSRACDGPATAGRRATHSRPCRSSAGPGRRRSSPASTCRRRSRRPARRARPAPPTGRRRRGRRPIRTAFGVRLRAAPAVPARRGFGQATRSYFGSSSIASRTRGRASTKLGVDTALSSVPRAIFPVAPESETAAHIALGRDGCQARFRA